MEGSGRGGRLCALAHARSPANTGLNAAGSRGGDFFFFPFERARAEARAGLLPTGRAPVRTRAHSLRLGLSAGRGVAGLTAPSAESSCSIPKVATQALLLSLLLHIGAPGYRHTRRTRPLSGVLSSQVIGMDGPSLEEAVTPSFLPTPRARTPERVGTRVWWPLASLGSSRTPPSTGASGPPPKGLPWRLCEPPFSR